MTESQLAFLVVAAMWAAVSAVATSSKMMNDTRNTVLLGYLGDKRLPKKHRELLLCSDWVSWSAFTTIGALVFATILFALPWLVVQQTNSLTFVCTMIGIVPVLLVAGILFYGRQDFQAMRHAIDNDVYIDDKQERAVREQTDRVEFDKLDDVEILNSKSLESKDA